MAKKQTKDEIIAAQAAQIENLNQVALNSLRERDNAKADVEAAKRQLNAIAQSPQDAKLHARLAAILFPDDDPRTLHADDLANMCLRHTDRDARISKWYKDAAKQLDVDTDLDCETLAEAIFEASAEAARAKQTLETLQSEAGGEEELAALVAWNKTSERTPEEWDRLAELVDVLGWSSNRLAYVLGSSDLQSSLRHVR